MVKTQVDREMKEKGASSSKPPSTKRKKNPLKEESPTNDQPVVQVPFMLRKSSHSGVLDSTTIVTERPISITQNRRS